MVLLERDTDLRRTVGHALKLTEAAMTALHETMPADWVRRLYALAQDAGNQAGYDVRDHRGRLLAQKLPLECPAGVATDRLTLRLLLTADLGESLHLGAYVVGYERRSRGRVAALLADGRDIEVDVLVAADGVGSAIASSLAGRATSSPTWLVGVTGRTLVRNLATEARTVYGTGATIVLGPGGYGLHSGRHRPLDQDVAAAFTDQPLHPEPMYVWGAVMLEWAQTAALAEVGESELREALAVQLRDRHWTRELVEMVDAADADSLTSVPFYASPSYPAGIAPWAPGVVTALGDAVHAMPPTGGQSASTAIRDAHVLVGELASAAEGRSSIVAAVDRYQQQMREYAAPVIAQFRRPSTWIVAPQSDGRWLPSPRETSLASAAVTWVQRSRAEPASV